MPGRGAPLGRSRCISHTGCAEGQMALDQEAMADQEAVANAELTSSGLRALISLLFGEQKALVAESQACSFSL